MTPAAAPLDAAILEGAIRSVNFFNGRLLTGEDLSREQEAGRRARALLGQACGEGVAHGLEVNQAATSTDARPVLEVASGLAVNRLGQTLELAEPVDLALTRTRGEGEEAEVTFADCAPLDGGGTFTAGAGIYMLTILPAQASEGLARVSGLLNEASTCASDTSVETVKFRLCRLHLRHQDVADANRIRNRLAHLAYGSFDPRLREFPRDPFAAPVERYGLLDDLRERSLGPAEVPLAMLRWTAVGGVRFVDLWSVRRRLTGSPAARRWPTLVGDRRRSEAEAMFLQFGQQVEDALGSETGLDGVAAADRFDFLPPVGVLPIVGEDSEQGFDPEKFFGDQASRDVAMTDGRLLAELVEDSLTHEPIQVGTSEKVQLYTIWENDQAVRAGLTGQRAMVFAKGTLRYRGMARFGYARWNLSRFAPHVI